MTYAPGSIADYAETVGARIKRLRATHGRQEGSPDRAAEIIFQTFLQPDPPLQLVLGKIAYEMAHANARAQLGELERHRPETLSFDGGAKKA